LIDANAFPSASRKIQTPTRLKNSYQRLQFADSVHDYNILYKTIFFFIPFLNFLFRTFKVRTINMIGNTKKRSRTTILDDYSSSSSSSSSSSLGSTPHLSPPLLIDPWDDVLIESTSTTPTLNIPTDSENNSRVLEGKEKESINMNNNTTPLLMIEGGGFPISDIHTKPIISRASYPIYRGYGGNKSDTSILPPLSSSSPFLGNLSSSSSSSSSVALNSHQIIVEEEEEGKSESITSVNGRGEEEKEKGGVGVNGVSAFSRMMKKSKSDQQGIGRPKFDQIATTLLFGTADKGGGGGELHKLMKPSCRPSLHSTTNTFSSSSASTPFSATTSSTPPPPLSSSSSSPPPPPSRLLCQSFLDLGQRSFDSQICNECGMAFCPGLKDDVSAHERHCAKVALKKLSNRYVPFTLVMRDENVLWTGQLPISNSNSTLSSISSRIICIRSDDLSIQRRGNSTSSFSSSSSSSSFASPRVVSAKIDDINALLERHLGSESFPKPSAVLEGRVAYFVMVENKKVIGVAVTERVNEAMLLTKKALSNTSSNQVSSPSSSSSISPMENKAIEDVASALSSGVNIEDARVSDTTVKVSLGVAQIWVHDDHRRRGIATRLLDMARASVIFAYEVQKSDVAFSMPTSGGLALARAYLATDQIPIYF
jgi:hypothetical protein